MLFLPFFFLFLISCSDNFLYNEATPHIFIDVLNRSDTVLVDKPVLFQARINPSPEDVEFFNWVIEKEDSQDYQYSLRLQFEKTFNENGLYKVKFYAKDLFYDEHETNLFIRVSSTPICDGLSIKIVQDSPLFEWNCVDTDGNGSLTYKFLLNRSSRIDTTILTENSLQLGYSLRKNDTISLIATNRYGIKARLDSVWGSP
jgi:hypothetical protein